MSTEEQITLNPSTEEQIITKPAVEKVKNPKRVAQGKKLAEISKFAKAAKKRERNLVEKQLENETSSFLQLPSLSTSVAVVGTATGVIGTYIAWKKFKQNQVNLQLPTIPEKVKYRNLDDFDI